MRVIWALAQRDIRGALRSPRYYILLAFYVFAQGYDFSLLFIDDGAIAVRQLLREIAFLALFAAPLLTAGSLAGERESGELDQLLSEPISETALVMGKALAGLVLLLPLIGAALVPVAAASHYGQLRLAPLLVGVAGLFLLAMTCAAAGIFASSFANHPASAAACSFGLLFLLAFLGIEAAQSEGLASFLTSRASPAAMNPFSLVDYLFRGIVDSRPLVFFPAATLSFLALAVIVLKSRRWAFIGREGPQGSTGHQTRSTLLATSLPALFVPVVGIFALVHLVNMHAHWSYDLSGYLSLSPTFKNMVSTLPDELTIYSVRYRSVSRERLDDLLDEVQRIGQGNIRVVPWNPRVHFQRLRPLGLLTPPQDGIVLTMRNRVTAIAKANCDVESRAAERAIAAAINRLVPQTNRQQFLLSTGHGELETEALRRLVSTIGFDGETIELAAVETIPTTATVLAIIGPRVALTPIEVSRVKRYLRGGGRLLLAIDQQHASQAASLTSLLPMKTTGALVVDDARSLAGGGPASLIVAPVAEHPITKMIGRLQLILPTAMALELHPPREDPLHAKLIVSGASSATVTAPADVSNRPRWSRSGPQTLALTCCGPRLTEPFKVAVFGDGDMFSDEVLLSYPTNAVFAQGVVSWLADSEAPDSIPREPIEVRVVLSKTQARNVLYGVAVLPSFLALACGFFAWYRYRRQFTAPAN